MGSWYLCWFRPTGEMLRPRSRLASPSRQVDEIAMLTEDGFKFLDSAGGAQLCVRWWEEVASVPGWRAKFVIRREISLTNVVWDEVYANNLCLGYEKQMMFIDSLFHNFHILPVIFAMIPGDIEVVQKGINECHLLFCRQTKPCRELQGRQPKHLATPNKR